MTNDSVHHVSEPPEKWFWPLAVLLAVVLAIPFFTVDVPPVLDYPNHLARYVVLANPDDPVLARFYAPHWRLVPNLGMDVIASGLLRVVDVYVGGRLLLALSLFAPIAGVVLYSRAAFGRFTLWSLASGVVAYNTVFQFGFMNFLLSLGVAFAGGASWIWMRGRKAPIATALTGALTVTIAFFCHIFGVALFAVLIGTWEVAQLRDEARECKITAACVLRRAALIAVALAPAIVLYFLSPLAGDGSSASTWEWPRKLWLIFVPVMTTIKMLTLLCGLTLFACIVLLWRDARFAPGAKLAMAVLGLAFLLSPSTFKGGTFVDARPMVVLALLPFAGISPR